MSTIYRERDRYDDSRTTISSGRREGGYTTVKRYIVKDDDTRSNYGRSDRRSFVPERAGERVEETRIVRREREVDEPVREARREEPRYSSEQLVIRRDNREDDRRPSYYEPRREERNDEREEIVIRRTKEVDEPRRDEVRRDDLTVARLDDRRESTQVIRRDYRDDYDGFSPTRGFEDRDLAKYSRQTDYYAPAPPPQTIIIKQEPIIIRERVRDDDYVSVRRSDVEEEKSVVRRERTPEPPRQAEEDFFYEKKVRERIDEPREREDEWRDRRVMRREVSPHDSVSQVGRRPSRSRRDSYSSDDSMVYVKRTKESYSDEGSPHRKKNLTAGVIAGIGAAELLRNHKKKEGQETSRGVGRLGRDVGAGALGAIAAEGISRARSRYRSKSRRRSRGRSGSGSRSRSRSRRRSRSRSESRSKLKTWGAVGLGAAALAAAAAIAQKKMGNKDKEVSPPRGRSESRGRQESVAELANDPNAPSNDSRNPKHRTIRMAEAGAAGAAITALIDHARSKSRGGRDRSRSRIRQAVPVVAAGLGSAALAGLYEKNKAKKEAQEISQTDRRERRASRSRSRQRSEYSDYPAQNPAANMIEYGDGPMYGNNYGREYYPGADQYGRPPGQEGYYANQTAVVPAAAAAAGGYAAQQGAARSLSGDRRSRSRSLSSSPGGHRRRHGHSRSRSGGREAAAAGVGAAATAEYERKERKRERRARKQQEQYGDPYEDTFNPHGYPVPTPPAADPYAANQQPGFYPQTSQFPPPPGTMPQQYPAQAAPAAAPAGAAYPNEFPPPPPGAPPAPGYGPYASGANPYAPRGGADENVSVPPNPTFPSDRSVPSDGVSSPRGPDPAANPSINIHPPSVSTPPNPNATLNVPRSGSYVPPTDRGPSPTRTRAVSQPPPNGPRKSVQFAEKPEVQPAPESEGSSPEQRRHRHRRERGYEAGDDTDTTLDDQQPRQRERGSEASRSLDPAAAASDDGRKKRHHHRRRSHDPSTSASSSKAPDRNQTISPAESDATVDLPARFDTKGDKKTEAGEDPVADRIDEILKGKGAAGKVFGNFVDGIFGPEGRRRSSGRDR